MNFHSMERKTPAFLFHHDKAINESFVERLIREVAPVSYTSTPPSAATETARGSPEWEAQVQRYIKGARRVNLASVSWSFPLKKERNVLPSPVFTMLRFHEFEVRMHKSIRLDRLMADADHWGMMSGNRSDVDWWESRLVDWFLEKPRSFIPFFEPDFGLVDAEETIVANLRKGEDPASLAWPLMVFGPRMVKKLGRDHLLDAPAWKVEELSYGGIWVQVWQNPLDVPQEQVEMLAKHLGLEPRRDEMAA